MKKNNTMKFLEYLDSISDREKLISIMIVKVIILILCFIFLKQYPLLGAVAAATFLHLIGDLIYFVNND